MALSRTRTVKNKHAAAKAGPSGKGADKGAKQSASDGISKAKKKPQGTLPARKVRDKLRTALKKKPKKKTYTAEELGIPELNMVTPVGVVKPPGKKKGKVFVDDAESMSTIVALVQAEKNGQIESKMIKARQLEEIREARQAEANKHAADKQKELEETKNALRKKRKRKNNAPDDVSVKALAATGSKAVASKKVSFA